MNRSWISTRKGAALIAAIVTLMLLGGGLASAIAAADATPPTSSGLAGTTWQISGPTVIRVKMGNRSQRQVGTDLYLLTFDATSGEQSGTCTLDIGPGEPVLPCTWTSRTGRRITLMLDSDPLRAALEQELEYQFGANVDMTFGCKPVQATVNAKTGLMRLKVAWYGTATSAAFPRPVKLWVTSRVSGTRISGPSPLAPAAGATPGLADRLVQAVERNVR